MPRTCSGDASPDHTRGCSRASHTRAQARACVAPQWRPLPPPAAAQRSHAAARGRAPGLACEQAYKRKQAHQNAPGSACLQNCFRFQSCAAQQVCQWRLRCVRRLCGYTGLAANREKDETGNRLASTAPHGDAGRRLARLSNTEGTNGTNARTVDRTDTWQQRHCTAATPTARLAGAFTTVPTTQWMVQHVTVAYEAMKVSGGVFEQRKQSVAHRSRRH